MPLGSLSLSVYRIVLLTAVLPCIFLLLRGKAGPVRVPDIGLFIYSLWAAVSFLLAHGVEGAIQPGGILFVETMGAYLLGRCYIRDAKDFRALAIALTKLVLLIAPFAVVEWATGKKPILLAFGTVFPTVEATLMAPRMGFYRVQGPFDHSILFGLLCGSVLSLTHLIAGKGRSFFARLPFSLGVAFTAILSMSSAPIAGLLLQTGLMSWNAALRKFKARWQLLFGIIFACYLVVEFGSNQTPIQFYISHFTFDKQTGWYRIWIWNYGSASVLAHPLFGIGFGQWARPAWMSDSIDNFWLVVAVRHGIPAVAFLLISILSIMVSVGFKKLDEALEDYRIAYLICIFTYLFVGTTVHFWTAAYAWFLFLLGSGVWLLDAKSDRGTVEAPQKALNSPGSNRGSERSAAVPVFTRFQPRQVAGRREGGAADGSPPMRRPLAPRR
ncbi:MAG TPA: polymerase [Rhizobiaceae bacterium]|nr:polymerase [Rhizobiaceae bacterium]